MNSSGYTQFQTWERTTRDTIDFKKIYVDIAGDLVAGLLLSQIIYWELPDRYGDSKLRVAKDSKWWLVKGRNDWWEEARIKPKRFDRACAILIKKGIIAKTYGRFNGLRTMHIRIVPEVFYPLWQQALDDISHAVPEKGKASCPKGEDRTSQKGKTELPERVRPLTETTTETTTESTIPPTAERTPTALSEKGSKEQDQREEQRTNRTTTRRKKGTAAEFYGGERMYQGSKHLLIHPEDTSGEGSVEVAEIWLEPEDTQLTCPHCEHTQPWPQSEGRRRKPTSLICQLGAGEPMDGCGSYFIVHGFKSNGNPFTYKLNIPEPHWIVMIDGVKWVTTEIQARLFLANWDEDWEFLLEKFVWAATMLTIWRRNEVVIQRVNAAFVTGMKSRAARQAEDNRFADRMEVFVDEETGEQFIEEPPY